jgi:hypothetical protein
MHTIDHPTKTVWYIAWGPSYIHYGSVEPGQLVSTVQPTLETFDSESEMLDRLAILGVVPPILEEPINLPTRN